MTQRIRLVIGIRFIAKRALVDSIAAAFASRGEHFGFKRMTQRILIIVIGFISADIAGILCISLRLLGRFNRFLREFVSKRRRILIILLAAAALI